MWVMGTKMSPYFWVTVSSRQVSCSCAVRDSMWSRRVATVSNGFTCSNWCCVVHCHSTFTIFSSASIKACSAFRSKKNSFSLHFAAVGRGGGAGFSKLNLVSLSITVLASWSITILLCFKNSNPNIIGAQREGAITAQTVFKAQEPTWSYRDSLTHSHNWTMFFNPDLGRFSSVFFSVFHRLFRYREYSIWYNNTIKDGRHCPTLYLQIHAANLEILKD